MRNHGLYTYRQLREGGFTRHTIQKCLADGELFKITRNWYGAKDADPDMVRALRARTRLGCLSGCKAHGLWVPHNCGLHFVYGPGTTPIRNPHHQFHWTQDPMPPKPVWPLLQCLDQVVKSHDTESALIVLESARYHKKATAAALITLLGNRGEKGELLQKHFSIAESGSETRVRLFLRQRRILVQPQVLIKGVGRVDLLVGRNLIIECDSYEFHAAQEQYSSDHRRDLAARTLGYDTIRLSYAQVWDEWEETQKTLSSIIGQRKHRSVPRPIH